MHFKLFFNECYYYFFCKSALFKIVTTDIGYIFCVSTKQRALNNLTTFLLVLKHSFMIFLPKMKKKIIEFFNELSKNFCHCYNNCDLTIENRC